jgi:hypothetical protein
MRSGATWRSSIRRTSAVFSSSAGLVATLVLLAAPAAAQERAVVSGRIVRPIPGDTVAAPGVRVVLHRIGRTVQGALDSLRTAADGQFRFGLVRDTAALFLVSARYGGIEYFSDPITFDSTATPPSFTLLVADTSSTVPVDLAGRYLVIGAPDAQRSRTVVDLFVLRNSGTVTRVARDSLTPLWRAILPAGATSHRVPGTGSEVSPQAVEFRGDTMLVFAPLSPGLKQLLVEHVFPAGLTQVSVPLGEGAAQLQVVTEEPAAMVSGAGMRRAESQVIDGRSLARWIGQGGRGGALELSFPGPGRNETPMVVALVALMAVGLVAGAWLGLRRRLAGGAARR